MLKSNSLSYQMAGELDAGLTTHKKRCVMEVSSMLNLYLDPTINAPLQEFKPMKAPDCERDVQRFEAILNGEGAFQPKSLDLVLPATEPNAIENVSQTILDKVSSLKNSVDSRIEKVNQKLLEPEQFTIGDALELQWELSMFSIESSLMAKSGDKAGEGIKTLFRNQ